MKYPLLISILLLALTLQAQTDPATGLLFEDETYDTIQLINPHNGHKAAMPRFVNLENYCPYVGNQGAIFSCVGWASGYGALTIERAIRNNCRDQNLITDNAHSALFIYNQIRKGDCKKGSKISDALDLLAEKGDCLAGEFETGEEECTLTPETGHLKSAQNYAIDDYMRLFPSNADKALKVKQVKVALANQKPVVIGMAVNRNFYQLQNAQYWWPDKGNTSPAGGHAMVVVGYDDHRQAFRLFNSWGAQWGDSGKIWVKYHDFAKYCKYAYIIMLSSDSPRPIRRLANNSEVDFKPLRKLSGDFLFRNFVRWNDTGTKPVFESAHTKRQTPGVYTTARKDWSIGQLFQIVANTNANDQYLYIFSVDAQRKVHVHFPRKGIFNKKFKNENESALFNMSGNSVVIPAQDKVLKTMHQGTDRLVILFSKKRIRSFGQLTKIIADHQGDFAEYLWATLADHAVPKTDITYHQEKIAFESNSRSEGYIVPLVLEINVRDQ